MSETITLGKSRKDGTWQILVSPEKPFGEHLDVYRKIANKAPVNADFSELRIGKIQDSSPRLRLITADHATERQKQETARQESVKAIVQSADKRQEEMNRANAAQVQKSHQQEIEEKNAMIDQVRRQTKQEPAKTVPETKPLTTK